MIHIVIIGTGIAGVSAAESARNAAPDSKITILGTETHLPYYRMNLTRLLAGKTGKDSIFLHDESWYLKNRIELLLGKSANSVSAENHEVTLDDGTILAYDKLILATGAEPCTLPVPGAGLEGVMTLRTLTDTELILAKAASRPACVCIGGGTLGIETAGALIAQGLKVTLLARHEWLMPGQLNRNASELLEKHLADTGIMLEKHISVKAIAGDKHVSGVELEDGRLIPADLVTVSTGARPDTRLARDAGINLNCGIVVDDHLKTSHPDIFAAGDAAEHNGIFYGTWAPAKRQGSVAGRNAAGIDVVFKPEHRANSLNILGLNIVSIGDVITEHGLDRVKEQQDGEKFYRFIFDGNGKMTGCILIGDVKMAASVKKAIENGTNFSEALAQNMTVAEILHFLAT